MEEDLPCTAKMSGYLWKKGKMRMVSIWKKYWFVLEGRLLLYYRSKDEYDAISPCKGSINLGPPCSVKSCPSVACVFQLENRANVITLKSESVEEQKRWMQSIMLALNQNQSIKFDQNKKLNHFRYSLDDLVPKNEPNYEQIKKKILERQHTMPDRLPEPPKNNAEIIQRLQRMGAQTYGGSLGAICKASRQSSPVTKKEISISQNSLTTNRILTNRINSNDSFIRGTNYSQEHLYERIPSFTQRSKSFIIDNENYSVPMKKRSNSNKEQVRDSESIIVENVNYCSVDKENENQKQSDDEVFYNEPNIDYEVDYNKNSVVVENQLYSADKAVQASCENEYEELDKFKESKLNKTNTKRKYSLFRKDGKKPEKSLKKSQSFIKKVWKKRNQPKGNQEAEQEKSSPEVTEKLGITDTSTVQMLSELQNILEHKKPILKSTLSSPQSTKSSISESTYEDNSAPTSDTDKNLGPLLPPKEKNKTNLVITECKSIDEVLDDLESDSGSKSKVKLLIDKFNDSSDNESVTLRNRCSPNILHYKNYRHSDELTRLLDELAKVTNAPVMTPGVTTSLINPNISDDELLKLWPVRRRRLSEPDYDIPRPHRSIQSTKNETDPIQPTRFFGPVLPQEVTQKEDSICISMAPDSLEIDENDKSPPLVSYNSHDYRQCKKNADMINLKNINKFTNNLKFIARNGNHKEEIIYALPKPYISVATHIVDPCQDLCQRGNQENTIIYKNVKNIEIHEEVFKDSLETCNDESLTEF